ncbi:hypothetical protein H0H87_007350 [Tephrocybe sp. NHM501043]|nr:hypothetical protein H0H87_007350 [Tephrocybe sp. NHM501043]
MATPAYNTHSPLDSLVRRTSTRKPDPTPTPFHPTLTATERPSHLRAPASPLLHSHFARNSTATTSSADDNSYLYSARTSIDSRNAYQDSTLDYYYDDESIYSSNTADPALRDSWQSSATENTTVQPRAHPAQRETNYRHHSQQPSVVPAVVISSPMGSRATDIPRTGRLPIVRPITNNFSRPVRPPVAATPENEEQKRRVLERNATRRAGSPSRTHRERPQGQEIRPEQPGSTASNTIERSPNPLVHNDTKNPGPSKSSMRSPPSTSVHSVAGPADLSNGLPPRRVSPVASLYSNYSYYPLPTPSAVDDGFSDPPLNPLAFTAEPRAAPQPPSIRSARSPTPMQSLRTPTPTQAPPREVKFVLDPPAQPAAPQKAQEYLQQGITHHEANRLPEAAACFEKSAKEDGGCGVGMVMWGLTLRHGWGCEKNEKIAFKWLQRAAESAVGDLENERIGGGVNSTAIQTELVLAIYEVGQCFFHGWGVTKDQKMGVSYYTVAARLGDPDAQCDLAFALCNGKGCKKDRKEAAKWYRAAVSCIRPSVAV